jgi:hypothetical protein
MRLSYFALVVAVAMALPVLVPAQSAFPRMTSVDPYTAKAGAVVSVAGENLDKANVAEVYLTDNKNDFKVEITEQAATSIKFKIPDTLKAGKFGLVIRTPGTADNPAKDYVQPVKVNVEE